jgi:hypothetical protein
MSYTPMSGRQVAGRGLILMALGILGVLALCALAWGLHLFGWGLTNDNIRRTDQAVANDPGAQAAFVSSFNTDYGFVVQITSEIEQVNGNVPQATIDQRLAYANKACADAAKLLPPLGFRQQIDTSWVTAHCAGAVVKPGDQLRVGS